jgi:hypothetical protein
MPYLGHETTLPKIKIHHMCRPTARLKSPTRDRLDYRCRNPSHVRWFWLFSDPSLPLRPYSHRLSTSPAMRRTLAPTSSIKTCPCHFDPPLHRRTRWVMSPRLRPPQRQGDNPNLERSGQLQRSRVYGWRMWQRIWRFNGPMGGGLMASMVALMSSLGWWHGLLQHSQYYRRC